MFTFNLPGTCLSVARRLRDKWPIFAQFCERNQPTVLDAEASTPGEHR